MPASQAEPLNSPLEKDTYPPKRGSARAQRYLMCGTPQQPFEKGPYPQIQIPSRGDGTPLLVHHRHPLLLAKRRHLRQLFQPNLAGANPFVAVHTRPAYGLGVVEMHQFKQRRVLFVNVCHVRQRVLVTACKDVAGVHTDAQPRIVE